MYLPDKNIYQKNCMNHFKRIISTDEAAGFGRSSTFVNTKLSKIDNGVSRESVS